jgi:hypothetical protein
VRGARGTPIRIADAAEARGDEQNTSMVVLGRSIRRAHRGGALLARRLTDACSAGRPRRTEGDKRTMLRRSFTMLAATLATVAQRSWSRLAQSADLEAALSGLADDVWILARQRLDVPPDM